MHNLQKRMQQLETDLDQVQESLLKANTQLEEKDKSLSNVSGAPPPHAGRRGLHDPRMGPGLCLGPAWPSLASI